MRLHIKALLLAMLCWPSGAQATTDNELAQARKLAGETLTREQEQLCLQDFTDNFPGGHAPFMAAGSFHFNNGITREVYDTLYWQGASHGVAFIVPVYISRNNVRNIACFYALTGKGLVFQSSQAAALRWVHHNDD